MHISVAEGLLSVKGWLCDSLSKLRKTAHKQHHATVVPTIKVYEVKEVSVV